MPGFIDNWFGGFVRTRVRPRATEGVGGTAVYGGYIMEEEKSSALQGRQKYITYSDILANLAIVAASTRFFLNLVSRVEWRVDPPEDGGPQAEEYAELIEEMMYDMTTPWHRVVRRAAMYKFYGFSVQEWTAKRRDDGLLGMRDVEPRPQKTIERWDLDETGTVVGCVQRAPQDSREIYLPRGKLVYMVDDSLNDSPEGLGLFRHLIETSQRVSRYMELEGFGFVCDLRGIPMGRGPFAEMQKMVENGTMTVAQAQLLRAPLESFIRNHIKNPQLGLILDSLTYQSKDAESSPSNVKQWDLELLKGDAPSLPEVAAAIERETRQLARILGTETLLLGDGAGSFALSKDKSHNFALMVDSALVEIAESLETDFVEVIFELNGWDTRLMPTLKTEAIQFRDVTEITAALRDMATAGASIMPEDPAVGEVRDLLGLSRTPDELLEVEREMREASLAGLMAAANPGENPDEVVPGEDEGTEED